MKRTNIPGFCESMPVPIISAYNKHEHALSRRLILLLGLHTSILDTRNHLPLPAEFGGQFEDTLYIAQGFERNVMVLTQRAFEHIYHMVMSLNLADPLARLLIRMILGTAHETKIDPGGGIFLPDSLKEFALLTQDVVLVGLGDYFEVWSLELWNQQEEKLLNVEANSNMFSAIVITTR